MKNNPIPLFCPSRFPSVPAPGKLLTHCTHLPFGCVTQMGWHSVCVTDSFHSVGCFQSPSTLFLFVVGSTPCGCPPLCTFHPWASELTLAVSPAESCPCALYVCDFWYCVTQTCKSRDCYDLTEETLGLRDFPRSRTREVTDAGLRAMAFMTLYVTLQLLPMLCTVQPSSSATRRFQTGCGP